MAISTSPLLTPLALLFGTIWVGFGLNAIFYPRRALSVFEFDLPVSTADQQLVDALIVLYGARDLFMGMVVYVAVYFSSGKRAGNVGRRVLGWVLILGSGVAVVDGMVVKGLIGRGEWNHWGYAPVAGLVGALVGGVSG